MAYSWLLFDADDTLFDFKKSARHSLQKTLEHFQITCCEDHFTAYEGINQEVWLAFERLEITAVELRRIRFERFLTAIGEWREPLEMNTHYLRELSQTKFLMEGAQELVLELLARNHRLGLITNGLREVQRPRIAQAGMEMYFDVIVVSDEIGVAKPHAGFFEKTFEAMKMPAKSDVLIIGDSLGSDIRGGNDFGVDTCWFNPGRQKNLTAHRPTFEIGSLSGLKDLL